MRRVLVIGPGGAGKSTLARRLAEITGLPLVHLDREYWREGWVPTPTAEWESRVAELLAGESWIMDGNYGSTIATRMSAADTVVFLDAPPWRCLLRVIARRFRYRGKERPDMTVGCPERLTADFLWFIVSYRWRKRAQILSLMRENDHVQRHILRTDAEVERFLDEVATL